MTSIAWRARGLPRTTARPRRIDPSWLGTSADARRGRVDDVDRLRAAAGGRPARSLVGARRAPSASSARAVSSGSGRSSRSTTSHASTKPTSEKRNVPASSGRPRRVRERLARSDEVRARRRSRSSWPRRRSTGHGPGARARRGRPRHTSPGCWRWCRRRRGTCRRRRAGTSAARRRRARAPHRRTPRPGPSRRPTRRPRAAVARATGIVEQRGAEHLGGRADARERLGAAEVLGEQRADGDAARHADPAEDLRPDEGADDLALQGRPVERGRSEDHRRPQT